MDVLERARALAATAVLGEVAAPTLIALAERARVREVDAGAVVQTRRSDGVVVMVVARGQVDEARGAPAPGEAAVTVARGPGALLGAAAALDAATPAAELRAVTAAVVLELGQDDFVDVLAEHPAAARALARELARALRESRR